MTKKTAFKRYVSLILSVLMIFAFVDNSGFISFAQVNDTDIITDTTGEDPAPADETEGPVDQTSDTQPEIPADDTEQTPALNLAQKDGVNEGTECTVSYNTPVSGTIYVTNGTTEVSDQGIVPMGTELTITYTAIPDNIPTINIYNGDNNDLLQTKSGELGGLVCIYYTVDSNIRIEFVANKCVSKIGNIGYTSLGDALNAVTTNSTITLLDDVEYNGETMPKYPVIINCPAILKL